ncbi:MAG: cbs domain containing protein [Cytophagales bacterium]|nr:cbs domain containing protein [Cytophagales bacterium]
MIAEELISHQIPTLKSTDKVKLALEWMIDNKLDFLAVCDDGVYKGLVTENALHAVTTSNSTVAKVSLEFETIFARDKQHLLEVLALAKKYEINVIPVLDEGDKYLGSVDLKNFYQVLANSTDMANPGGIMVISVDMNDYVLSQISRLVESHTARILLLYTSPDASDPLKMDLTLKINKTDISAIISTLERYNFNVVAYYQETEVVSRDKDRLDLLLKYINL